MNAGLASLCQSPSGGRWIAPECLAARFVYLVLLMACLAYGCSAEPAQPVSVHGAITVRGKPAPRVNVLFLPLHGDDGWGRGITDEQGRYALQGQSGQPGIVPGEYNVIFRTAQSVGARRGTPPRMQNLRATASAHRITVTSASTQVDFNLDAL